MTDIKKVINEEHAIQAAQNAEDFWSRIDGEKLAQLGLKDKNMDLLGPKKEPE